MEVRQSENEKNGVFYIVENDLQIATMTYVFAGADKFIIDHTEVKEGNEGKGLGKLLVKAAVDFARNRQLKILPLCPFAKGVFSKTTEYQDLLFL
jgi:hypothetical protein